MVEMQYRNGLRPSRYLAEYLEAEETYVKKSKNASIRDMCAYANEASAVWEANKDKFTRTDWQILKRGTDNVHAKIAYDKEIARHDDDDVAVACICPEKRPVYAFATVKTAAVKQYHRAQAK